MSHTKGSSKARRHDGWVTPLSTIKTKKQILIDECLEPQPFWDDWNENRDGMRGYPDRTKIQSELMWCAEWLEVSRWNKKNKRLLYRRKLRKQKNQ